MTYFSPQNNSIISGALITVLTCGVLVGVVGLIVLYNQVVSLQHKTELAKEEISNTKEAVAGLREQSLMLFEGDYAEKVVRERGLIVDRNPIYLSLDQSWEFASRY